MARDLPPDRPNKFRTVHVTQEVHDLIRDWEIAAHNHAAASRERTGDTFGILCQRRKDLYKYIEKLEAAVDAARTVVLRFD